MSMMTRQIYQPFGAERRATTDIESTAVPRDPDIPAEMGLLANGVNELESVACALANKLAPLVRPEPSAADAEDMLDASRAPLADAMRALRRRLQLATSGLAHLLQAVEL